MFDPTKPVQTRDGHPARIICTDMIGDRPIAAIITETERTESVLQYRADGQFGEMPYRLDLINIPVRHKRWMNLYYNTTLTEIYTTRAAADYAESSARPNRIACIEIEFEEGL